MMRVDLSAPLVTIEDVIRLRDERDQVSREIAHLTRKFEELDSKLNAITLWLPPDVKYQIFDASKVEEDNDAYAQWERALIPIFMAKGHGLTTGMVRLELQGHPMESEVGFQGRNLYKALGKMVFNKTLVRDDDYYMLPGQSKPEDGTGLSMATILRSGILDFFDKHQGDHQADEIRQKLSGTKAGELAHIKPTSFYNALSKLTSDNKLIRDGRVYRLPPKKNEPSDVSPSSGSDAASVFT